MDFKKLPLALGLALVFASGAAVAQYSGTLQKIKDSGTIQIGARDSQIPFSYKLGADGERLLKIPGVEPLFGDRTHFHELALKLPKPAADVVDALAARRIVGGVSLGEEFPQHGDALLVCTTETKRPEDLDAFADALAAVLA